MTGRLKWSFLIREEGTRRLLDNLVRAPEFTFTLLPKPETNEYSPPPPIKGGWGAGGIRAVSDIRPILDNV